jgi:CIC family chloride channel protein
VSPLYRHAVKTTSRLYNASQARLFELLRRRVWLQEKLQPTEWQVTLWWAAIAGTLGALAAILFTILTEGVHEILTGSRAGIVESMRVLPWWGTMLVPAIGGLLAGLILLFGRYLLPGKSSTDYMEAISIGSGRLPIRASLIKSAAALFSIGSGGSIGREGPLVHMAATMASLLGRWRELPPPRQRLLVACGAASGIASAYNAPIAGSFFVAEIILGTIAMESLGPLIIASVSAALTVRVLTNAANLYAVPAFQLDSPKEIFPYIVLGLMMGVLAPWFLRTLRRAEAFFLSLHLPLIARLTLGGLLVGCIAVFVPEVTGNGYSVVVSILNGGFPWAALLLVMLCKWFATASSFGSGAPGGVFTPALFMGASSGFIFGTAVNMWWPEGAVDPRAFALVGMGAFLAAASHAPIMAIIMMFEMTLSYDIVLPLMMCSVIAYYTAKGLEGNSLYSESLKKRAEAEQAEDQVITDRVEPLIKQHPPELGRDANFAEIARLFLSVSVNHIYITDDDGKFVGVVALHDIKPYLGDPQLASVVIAADILRDDFPTVKADATLSDALGRFMGVRGERLPVIDEKGLLIGSLSKSDLLLVLAETKKPDKIQK